MILGKSTIRHLIGNRLRSIYLKVQTNGVGEVHSEIFNTNTQFSQHTFLWYVLLSYTKREVI